MLGGKITFFANHFSAECEKFIKITRWENSLKHNDKINHKTLHFPVDHMADYNPCSPNLASIP